MSDKLESFRLFRERMNERILGEKHQVINRFFALDTRAYEPSAVDAKTKEMMGLSASMVLRCDDCISYHVIQCVDVGCTDQELWECFDIALIVGGSIVIPHLRRAVDFLDEARQKHPKPAPH